MKGRDNRRQDILDRAREAGFDLAGIAPLRAPKDADRFDAWLAAGKHGSMDYLRRGRDATVAPHLAWARGRSLLVVGFGHSRPPIELAGGGRIARYAAGRDYHNVVGKKLQRLRRALVTDGVVDAGSAFVDATPLLERSHAGEAGIGFSSKAANLLHPRFGPWFFLGEIILECELEPTGAQVPAGSCGTCTACIDACPTEAITSPGSVDATRCISYATIENPGLVPHELREKNGPWAFGCDVCSEVCPWESKAPDLSERFGTRPEFERDADEGEILAELLVRHYAGGDEADGAHRETFRGSPLKRPRREGIARNAAIALGATPSERGRDALLFSVEKDRSPVVRSAAAWGLSRAHAQDAGVAAALDRALAREPSPLASADMSQSLDRMED